MAAVALLVRSLCCRSLLVATSASGGSDRWDGRGLQRMRFLLPERVGARVGSLVIGLSLLDLTWIRHELNERQSTRTAFRRLA